MDKIKCPNCGSTQVTFIWEDRASYDTKKIKEYKCKCGCIFEAIFTLTEINFLDKFKEMG
jgi:DNA-directed RNA polymerase subunit M/transcription elongation factor TFIIS